jgi:hypothetical protein
LSLVLLIIAIVCFILAALGATVGDLEAVRLTALGLVFFAGAHLPLGGRIP